MFIYINTSDLSGEKHWVMCLGWELIKLCLTWCYTQIKLYIQFKIIYKT